MRGWTKNQNDENYQFREQILRNTDIDILALTETFLKGEEKLCVDGYRFIGNNRQVQSQNARRGSGGVGVLIKDDICNEFDIGILDDTGDGILWIYFKTDTKQFNICICYLPPETSKFCDAQEFYTKLLEQIYIYQGVCDFYVVGDLNSRCGEYSDYIEGVDDMIPREVIDFQNNRNGDALIDLLIECNMCIVNGRVGTQDYTNISSIGKSVVDYLLVPHEQLQGITEFKVQTITDLINTYGLHGYTKVPDHSLLQFTAKFESERLVGSTISHITSDSGAPRKFKVKEIPENFLNDEIVIHRINETLHNIQESIDRKEGADVAYRQFINLMIPEMEEKLEVCKRNQNAQTKRKTHKKMSKPYWNDELNTKWDVVCKAEREFKKCKNRAEAKRKRQIFCDKRKEFDKFHRKEKRKYQLHKQTELENLQCEGDTRDFWKTIGKMGISNERSRRIPEEIVGDGGVIVTDQGRVLNKWKYDYETLYNETPSDVAYDDQFLHNIKESMRDGDTSSFPNMNIDELNCDISIEEVRKAVYRAKLNKAVGVDELPSEVLRNEKCVVLLHKIIRYCFEEGQVPNDWCRTIINPILKADKDPRDPLGYRGIALISVPCKIYADILNQRLSSWLESNSLLADEQNGFRKERSCIDHLYSLTSIVRNRKLNRKSTFVCFIDAKKAFDCVNRDLLWYKLLQFGINGKFLDALKSLYEGTECAVKVNDHMTDFFRVRQGVKQGCKISPTIFAMYINDLASDINALGCGVTIDDVQLAILLYADDIALIAPDEAALQKMLDAVHEWCRRWRMSVNRDKTKILHFRPASVRRSDYTFVCGDIPLDYE